MPLAEAMSTQRAVRRLLPDPVDDETVLARARARHQGAHRQQPAGLGVRGRPRPRREAPARPPQPPGLVGLPPARQAPGPATTSTPQDLDAVQWQADHFEEVPVVVVACLHGRGPVFRPPVRRPPGTARSSRPSRTCSWRPGPSASAPPSPRSRSGRSPSPAARSGSRPRSPRAPWSRSAGRKGDYGPTTRRPVGRSRAPRPLRESAVPPLHARQALRLRLRQTSRQCPAAAPDASCVDGPLSATGSQGQVTTCQEKDEPAASAKRAS